MNIVITSGIFPPDIGGPATYVPDIAAALSLRGHTVSVVTLSEKGAGDVSDAHRPYIVDRVARGLPLPFRLGRFILLLRRRSREADVILSNGMFVPSVLANVRGTVPWAVKIVGDDAWERSVRRGWTRDQFEDFQGHRQGWRAEVQKTVRSTWLRRTDGIIVPSEYLKKVVIGWGAPPSRCRVIYNAVKPVLRNRKGQAARFSGRLRLLAIGRLVPWKHFDSVIEALAQVPEAVLTIVGDGPMRGSWERLTEERELTARVRFLGRVPPDEIAGLLASHNVLVLPSSYEGLPHVAIEALQAGVPVVASPAGGTPEVVEHGVNGLLVDRTRGLVVALQRLVSDPELLERLGRGTGRTISRRFGRERMIEQTESFLMEIAGSQ